MSDTDQLALLGRATDTLEQARREVVHGRDRGVTCPCCGQHAQTYKRAINSSMARALIALDLRLREIERAGFGPLLQVSTHLFRFLREKKIQHSDAPALRHWGVIAEVHAPREDGNPRGGFYRITELGCAFVRGAEVARYVHTYNDAVVGFSAETTTIRHALGTRFDYDDLMRG